jgi:hypothetical protein
MMSVKLRRCHGLPKNDATVKSFSGCDHAYRTGATKRYDLEFCAETGGGQVRCQGPRRDEDAA